MVAGGQLLDVVRDGERRELRPRCHRPGEGAEEQLPSAEIEAGGGLVEHEQRGGGDQRPREQDAGPLPLGAARERPLRERPGADVVEQRARRGHIAGGQRVGQQDRAGDPGEHDVERPLLGIEAAAEGGLDEADPAPQLRHARPAELLAEHGDGAGARAQLGRGEP